MEGSGGRVVRLAGLMLLLTAAMGSGGADPVPVGYDKASRETVQQRLDQYKGNDTRREAALKAMFAEVGCGGVREQAVPGRRQPNVICVLPGSTTEEIVVGAHFDHVAAGEGVVDNWSGASLLPSLYQALANAPRKHTYVFVGFTGEEEGLLGSKFYVGQVTPEEIGKISLMVNLDTLGLGPTEVWVKQSDPLQVSLLAGVAREVKVSVRGMNVDGFGESDEESFIRRKVCVLMVHSLTPGTAYVLHNSADNARAIRFGDLYDTYQLLAAYLAVVDLRAVPEGHVCEAQPVGEVVGGSRARLPRRSR